MTLFDIDVDDDDDAPEGSDDANMATVVGFFFDANMATVAGFF